MGAEPGLERNPIGPGDSIAVVPNFALNGSSAAGSKPRTSISGPADPQGDPVLDGQPCRVLTNDTAAVDRCPIGGAEVSQVDFVAPDIELGVLPRDGCGEAVDVQGQLAPRIPADAHDESSRLASVGELGCGPDEEADGQVSELSIGTAAPP